MQACSWHQSVSRLGRKKTEDLMAVDVEMLAQCLGNALNHVMNEKILSRVRVHRTQHTQPKDTCRTCRKRCPARRKLDTKCDAVAAAIFFCPCCCLGFALGFCHLTGLFILFCYARQTACVKDLTNCSVCVCVRVAGAAAKNLRIYVYIKNGGAA